MIGRLIVSAVVRNERRRWLEPWLTVLVEHADVVVLLDDASDDGSEEVFAKFAGRLLIHRTSRPIFMESETQARSMLWDALRRVAREGDWIVLLDADEIPTEEFWRHLRNFSSASCEVKRLDARLFEAWSESAYRCDGLWSPWMTFAVRFEDKPFRSEGASDETLHCGRLPEYATEWLARPLRGGVIHLGYSSPEARERKSAFYLARNEGVNLMHARTILQPPSLRPLSELEQTPHVLVGVPIRNRAWAVDALFDALEGQDHPSERMEVHLFVNDSTDETERRCRDRLRRSRLSGSVHCLSLPEPPPIGEHVWRGPAADPKGPLRRMSRLRNLMLQALQSSGADALLALDSDVLPSRGLVRHLAACREPIVSPVFWAGWGLNAPRDDVRPSFELMERPDLRCILEWYRQGRMPQVWEKGQYSLSKPFLGDLMFRRGVHRVGGLGAATWIAREVADAGVSYDEVPLVADLLTGEDRHFCLRASCTGFDLRATSYLPVVHLDDPAELTKHPHGFANWEDLIAGEHSA